MLPKLRMGTIGFIGSSGPNSFLSAEDLDEAGRGPSSVERASVMGSGSNVLWDGAKQGPSAVGWSGWTVFRMLIPINDEDDDKDDIMKLCERTGAQIDIYRHDGVKIVMVSAKEYTGSSTPLAVSGIVEVHKYFLDRMMLTRLIVPAEQVYGEPKCAIKAVEFIASSLQEFTINEGMISQLKLKCGILDQNYFCQCPKAQRLFEVRHCTRIPWDFVPLIFGVNGRNIKSIQKHLSDHHYHRTQLS